MFVLFSGNHLPSIVLQLNKLIVDMNLYTPYQNRFLQAAPQMVVDRSLCFEILIEHPDRAAQASRNTNIATLCIGAIEI